MADAYVGEQAAEWAKDEGVMICEKCGADVSPIPECGIDRGGNRRTKLICPNSVKYPHSVHKIAFFSNKGYEHVKISYDDSIPCDVEGCTNTGADEHHFAPRHLYGYDDAEKYPKMNLCKLHHDLWHRLTNTGHFYKEHVKPEYQIQNKTKVTK